MGGDGGGGRGLRADAAATGGGGGGRRGRTAAAAACVELCRVIYLISWREGHLVIGEVTHFPPQSSRCGRTEFLRRRGHDKSRVRILYPKPDGILYYYFVPTSDVACVETGINTIRNRTQMCTHPTGGSPQYVPKPRLRYGTPPPPPPPNRIHFKEYHSTQRMPISSISSELYLS
jgi:hypothetical protein